jgi:hypothetical protein
MRRAIGIILSLPLFGACDERRAPDSGVTAEESAALNETENMLDASDERVAAEEGNSGDLLIAGEKATNAD